MANISFNPMEQVTPSDTDAVLALESARKLAPRLAMLNGSMDLRVVAPDGSTETVTIPTSAFRLLVTILAEMASGNAVRLIPHHAKLTTQEAAELLNVSRPYLVRLLDEGRIPCHRVGAHRRVLFLDVMTYKSEHRRARLSALEKLTRLDQKLGLT